MESFSKTIGIVAKNRQINCKKTPVYKKKLADFFSFFVICSVQHLMAFSSF